MRERAATYEIVRCGPGSFGRRLLDGEGRALAQSARTYAAPADAEADIAALQDLAPYARQVVSGSGARVRKARTARHAANRGRSGR